MDTTEGGALVENNRSSGVGERQGSQPRMRGATRTLLPFPGVAQPLERPNFTGLGVSEPINDLLIKVWEQYNLFRAYKKEGSNKHIRGCSSVPEKLKLQIRELDARQ
ncbi:hypothetical protein R1flu_023627 [Riccia fluitans]|uniref:Uncharacterized protein n=1 Tax=Riccia fluitans TaxID=41844 RepID=A0ABD1XT20_9MARC